LGSQFAWPPAERRKSFGCRVTNFRIAVVERGFKVLNGAAVADLAEGSRGVAAQPAVLRISERGR
jgi:hypothetical protein